MTGAAQAPFFQKGRSTNADWLATRAMAAPWAEIGSAKFVLTVPSSMVRNLADAAAIADYWDIVIDTLADLVGVRASLTALNLAAGLYCMCCDQHLLDSVAR